MTPKNWIRSLAERYQENKAANMARKSLTLVALSLAFANAGVACADKGNSGKPTPLASVSGSTGLPAAPSGSSAVAAQGTSADAGASKPSEPEHYLGALSLYTPILSEMEWPPKEKDGKKKDKGSVHLGYLRQGEKTAVIPEPHVKGNCSEGWYELVGGGFVCGKHGTLDLNHPRFRTGPHAAYTDRALPYDYGYNAGNGTPLYRVVPSREERTANEPWLSQSAPRKKKRNVDDEADLDAGAPTASNDTDAGAVPWYMRDYDGGKPQVTMDDLREEGPVAKRMVKGFFLSLDKPFVSGGSRWWRTNSMLIAPADRIVQWKAPTDFHGVWLNDSADTATHKSPALLAFSLLSKAKKYTVNGKHASAGGDLARHTIMRLTGESLAIGNQTYWETEEGWYFRESDGARTKPGEPPKDLKKGEKWVDVSLSAQTLVAFEGDKPVYATLVSTGRRSPIKEKDHATPTGSFRIREKHVAATMDGDVASDGPYSIEDVPWIMYFQGSYALHGAFWHANFGHTQSHGCVNLAPADAKAIFGWTEPQLPEGWHGAFSTPDRPGTIVVVHD